MSLPRNTFCAFFLPYKLEMLQKLFGKEQENVSNLKLSLAGESHFPGNSDQMDVIVPFPSPPSCHSILQILQKDGSVMHDPAWASAVAHVTHFARDWD